MPREARKPLSPLGLQLRDLAAKNPRLRTKRELADALGVTSMTLYRWETGATKPSPKELRKIADLLRSTPEELVGEVDVSGGGRAEADWKALLVFLMEAAAKPLDSPRAIAELKDRIHQLPLLRLVGWFDSAATTALYAAHFGSNTQRAAAAEILDNVTRELLEEVRAQVFASNTETARLRGEKRDLALTRHDAKED